MRLGIDFGTTRTVVAAADRGNYPAVSFQDEAGEIRQWFPALAAARGDRCVFGFEAAARQGEVGWTVLRSFKRLLAGARPESVIRLGEWQESVLRLLSGYLERLKEVLTDSSNAGIKPGEPLEALVAVPANANSNQRFLTIEAFRAAGFKVLGLINEPSAAGIEYAHRERGRGSSGRQEHLVVYDLGGGTFDTSVVRMQGLSHEVLTNEGIAELGGDDFDGILLELALARAGAGPLPEAVRFHLLEECRERKEALHPNTRRIVVDLGRAIDGAGEVSVPAAEFYAECQPLVERTIAAVEEAVRRAGSEAHADWKAMAGLYVVGGSSDLPVVTRTLRERYGRRVRRSPYPFASTAIGLAVAADAGSGCELRERFTRHFGVWREAEGGRRMVFDPVFPKETPVPPPGAPPLALVRSYRPVHNLGHFRYLECGGVTTDGQPSGDITPWDEILFPFAPALKDVVLGAAHAVERLEGADLPWIEERYTCDSGGMIEVEIGWPDRGFTRRYRLRRPAQE